MKTAFASTVLAVATLSGCGGDNKANAPLPLPPGATLCRAVGGGDSTVVFTTAPNGASFSQPNNVFDADFTTFAVLDTPNGTGTSSIRGVQQAGLIEPIGEVAGVLLSAAKAIPLANITINTYLDGAKQDGGAAQLMTMAGDASTGINYFYGYKTTMQFNSIEASLALKNDPVQVNIFELCVQK